MKSGSKNSSGKSTAADPFQSFTEAFLFFVPDSYTSFYSEADLESFIRARFEFFAQPPRKNEEFRLRVYNPGPEFPLHVNATIIEAALPDSRFIVDTLVDYCKYRDFRIKLLVHPVFATQRDASGALEKVDFADHADAALPRETQIFLQIARVPDETELHSIEADLARILAELRDIVREFPAMSAMLAQAAQERDEFEQAVVRWLQDNFVLLGATRLENGSDRRMSSERLGILRERGAREALQKELQTGAFDLCPGGAAFRETQVFSRVNRRWPYFIAVLPVDAPAGGRRASKKKASKSAAARTTGAEAAGDGLDFAGKIAIIGHFASRSEGLPRREAPILRDRLEAIAARFRASETSYHRKEIMRLAHSLPMGLLATRGRLLPEVFQFSLSRLYSDEIEYEVYRDDDYDMLWIAVVAPERDADQVPNPKLFEAWLEETDGEVAHRIRDSIYRNAFLLLGVRSRTSGAAELRERLRKFEAELFDSWSHKFRRLIANRYVGDETIARIMQRYFGGLPPEYPLRQRPEEALLDLDALEALPADDAEPYRVYYYSRDDEHDALKLYSRSPAALSAVIPTLSNFGFSIQEELTLLYKPEPDDTRYVHAFFLEPRPDLQRADRARISRAVAEALNGASASDLLDGLALRTPLDARELTLVKALAACYFQGDKSYSRIGLQNVLLKYPRFVERMIALFHARLAPLPAKSSEGSEDGALAAIEAEYDSMDSPAEESLCRSICALVCAIVRTNFYSGRSDIALKLRSRELEYLPEPRPLFEIFVYAPDLEGVHLRGGYVARGGLRWSDRQDDFRTEVLGLMNAQMVKNTIIPPVGSKGGFVLKQRVFPDREAFRAAGIAGYKRYIRCLLELTDNLGPDGSIQPAPALRRRDGDDAYLVVAADKGTAAFSDIANEISQERGFWLDDAFASGGANGYDHKKQGITAKGAWESVRRHCFELGLDPERDALRVVGIGDMGGDVFGNGLLLSQSVQLIAAFNHLHIFLDPDPDPAASWKERKRLFDAGLGWDQYDSTLISRGGGVFDRNSRKIKVSQKARTALGLRQNNLSGEELIRAILKAPVDLLWNGGIGTYVKASRESHYDARDPSNDRVRIDATELRARILGEGGNLGLTQAARIEAAEKGVRLNSDAIDNSAGVNMSDHEVNLKIMLDSLVRQGELADRKTRNRIIRQAEPEMMELVLQTNRDNNLALSLDERRCARQFVFFRALIKNLNREGWINRERDNIPFEADLDRIEGKSRTLFRPVLCSLLGFTKLMLADRFLGEEEFRDPWYDRIVLRYFPESLVRKHRSAILNHPLKREIIVTEVLNHITNRAGMAYFQRMAMRTFTPPVRIARIYMRLAEFLNLEELRASLEAPSARGASRSGPGAELIYDFLISLEEKVFRINKRMLETPELEHYLDDEGAEVLERILTETADRAGYRPSRELRTALRPLEREAQERAVAAYRRVHALEDAFQIYLARRMRDARWTVADYFGAIEAFRIDELRRIVYELGPNTTWEIRFLSRIDDDIEALLLELLERGWTHAHAPDANQHAVLQLLDQVRGLHSQGQLTPAGFFEMLEHVSTQVRSAQ